LVVTIKLPYAATNNFLEILTVRMEKSVVIVRGHHLGYHLVSPVSVRAHSVRHQSYYSKVK